MRRWAVRRCSFRGRHGEQEVSQSGGDFLRHLPPAAPSHRKDVKVPGKRRESRRAEQNPSGPQIGDISVAAEWPRPLLRWWLRPLHPLVTSSTTAFSDLVHLLQSFWFEGEPVLTRGRWRLCFIQQVLPGQPRGRRHVLPYRRGQRSDPHHAAPGPGGRDVAQHQRDGLGGW